MVNFLCCHACQKSLSVWLFSRNKVAATTMTGSVAYVTNGIRSDVLVDRQGKIRGGEASRGATATPGRETPYSQLNHPFPLQHPVPVVFIELYEAGLGGGLANEEGHYKQEEERVSPPVSRHGGGDVTHKQDAAAAGWPPRRHPRPAARDLNP